MITLTTISEVDPELSGNAAIHFSFDIGVTNLDIQNLGNPITCIVQEEKQRIVIGRRQYSAVVVVRRKGYRMWNIVSISDGDGNKIVEYLRSQGFVTEAGNPELIAAYNSKHPFNFAAALKRSRNGGYLEYLQSDHWQETRKAALERAGHRCQVCATTTQLEVHHNSYENLWNEKPEDLVVLCRKHHQLFHDER